MTTTIRVKVEHVATDLKKVLVCIPYKEYNNSEQNYQELVQEGFERDFHIHDANKLIIKEATKEDLENFKETLY